MPQERLLGMKKLTLDTWLDPDEAMGYFVIEHADLNSRSTSHLDNWASQVLAPQLAPEVPDEVRALYEVARGAALYATFYYPLMALASEQLYRVADAALAQRLGDSHQSKTFSERIKIAVKTKVIAAEKVNAWQATRELRNHSSHPSLQSIVVPGWALETLAGTAELINKIYK